MLDVGGLAPMTKSMICEVYKGSRRNRNDFRNARTVMKTRICMYGL